MFWREWRWLFPNGIVPFGCWKVDTSTGKPVHVRQLSPRLRQTLGGVLRGESYTEIADRLGISGHTVREHIERLYNLFDVSSRAELRDKCLDAPPD